MRGILNINKPAGISSYDCIRQLKRVFQSRRIGHAGTLDPIATGILLILLEEATKIARLLLTLPKEYEAEMRLGVQTDTDDITGKIIHTAPLPDLTAQEVAKVLKEKFTGTLRQVPPRFSALKSSGEPLYKLARKGVVFTPAPRTVRVFAIRLLEWHPPFARIFARASSGTYIRALCRDIGKALGSSATLTTLTRTKVGDFTIQQAYPLSEITRPGSKPEAFLIPVVEGLKHLSWVSVSTEQAKELLQGKRVMIADWRDAAPEGDLVGALTQNQRFLAIVKLKDRWLSPERIVYAD